MNVKTKGVELGSFGARRCMCVKTKRRGKTCLLGVRRGGWRWRWRTRLGRGFGWRGAGNYERHAPA
jgi:hypothetical protein